MTNGFWTIKGSTLLEMIDQVSVHFLSLGKHNRPKLTESDPHLFYQGIEFAPIGSAHFPNLMPLQR
jgi:hypothetical protein